MKKLRLLLTEKCDRNCKGCCNNQYDLVALPVETDFTGYSEIILTGGEPMLRPLRIIETVKSIRKQNPTALIVMYTAKTDLPGLLRAVLNYLDGLTVTIHKGADWWPFLTFNSYMSMDQRFNKLLRLNVFEQAGYSGFSFERFWQVRKDIEWITDCPLPEGEVFKRVKNERE